MNTASPQQTLDQRIELGAADGIYYAHEWFPQTFRQTSPAFHYEMSDAIESLDNRFIAFEVFRGGAKTTLLRTCASKRIAYGLSRVIVYSSAAQRHAERSIRWLKRQVETNTYWTNTFGLRKGSKWTDYEIEIINELLGIRIYALAVGMTGQTRGINIDDYRPDFWVVDDPNNEENTNTEEAREKTNEFFFGSMQNSLTPASENPHTKMALAQTSLDKEDLINMCHQDPTWTTVKYSILDENGNSRWEDRFPTKEVLQEKAGYIGRGQLHIWMREKECSIVPAEGKAFNIARLQFYDWEPSSMVVYIGIDPARAKHANAKKAHKAAIVQIGVNAEGVFLLDYYAQKGKNPEELWSEFYRMATRRFPRMTGVESIAYQQVLAWYFRQKMKELNQYFVVREIEDRRKKPDRIRQAYSGLIEEGRFFVKRSHTDFIMALDEYSDEKDIDVLDAGAIAITLSSPTMLMLAAQTGDDEEDYEILIQRDEANIPDLPAIEHCP